LDGALEIEITQIGLTARTSILSAKSYVLPEITKQTNRLDLFKLQESSRKITAQKH
jgi:hypothetical protein